MNTPATQSCPPVPSAVAAGTREHPFLNPLAHEQDIAPLRIEGHLPTDLRGTFYRNAPARYDAGTRPHWFDGAGAVTAVRLDGRSAVGGVKLLHTPSIDFDHGREQPRYGGFRQPIGGRQRLRALFGDQAVRNLANINLLPWQGRLFALYETTLPVEIDPVTLATLGETDLDGVILKGWNAHPRRVASRHTIYQFGVNIGAKVTLDVFALPASGPAELLTRIPLPGVMELHDFFATDNHLVFVLAPLWCSSLDLLRKGSFVESLVWQHGQPTTVLVMPLAQPHKIQHIETEPFFFWHGVNAFERDGGNEIVLDLVRYPDFATTKRVLDAVSDGTPLAGPRGGTLWRGVISRRQARVQWEERWAQDCEFPSVHKDVQGRPHHQTWLAGRTGGSTGWYDSLCRVDLESGASIRVTPGPDCDVSEPSIVARSTAEDDVYVLALIADRSADASWLGIWDGRRIEDAPLARVWFDQRLPPPLHGCWIAAA